MFDRNSFNWKARRFLRWLDLGIDVIMAAALFVVVISLTVLNIESPTFPWRTAIVLGASWRYIDDGAVLWAVIRKIPSHLRRKSLSTAQPVQNQHDHNQADQKSQEGVHAPRP